MKRSIISFYELSEAWQAEAKSNLDEYAEETMYLEPEEGLEEGIDIVNLSSIHEKGYRSANGSGIGIFINEDK